MGGPARVPGWRSNPVRVEKFSNDVCDSTTRLSVAIWVFDAGHAMILALVSQELHGSRYDTVRIVADQPYRSGFYAFGPLSLVPEHEDRFTERWALLLDAAGICDDEVRLAQEIDELMSSIARRAGNLDTTRTAVLACLHLADRLRTVERQLETLRDDINHKTRDFALLLDEAVAGAETEPRA